MITNDPNTHPNANLDKSHPLRDMVEIQIEEVYDIDQNGNYSTIGIESKEQNDGVQYLFSTQHFIYDFISE